MSIRTIITEGFGSFGTVPDVVRMGFGASAEVPPAPPMVVEVPGGSSKSRKRKGKTRYWWEDEQTPPPVVKVVPAPVSAPEPVRIEAQEPSTALADALSDRRKKRKRIALAILISRILH